MNWGKIMVKSRMEILRIYFWKALRQCFYDGVKN